MTQHTPGCIDWPGAIDSYGYGRLQVGPKWKQAHRVVWERKHGNIPKTKQIDHLCRNRKCVNVEHMELVVQRENILRGNGPTAQNARKTHCKRGHPLSGKNLMVCLDGGRWCRECGRLRWRAYRQRKIMEGAWTRT